MNGSAMITPAINDRFRRLLNHHLPRIGLGIVLLFVSVVCAQVPVTDEQIGDPAVIYLDPEFWISGRTIVWQQQQTGEVWTALIDPNTGYMIPADGKGQLKGVAAPITSTLNGPEFGFSAGEGAVYYVGLVEDRLVVFRTLLGEFSTEELTNDSTPRYGLIPSEDRMEPSTRLVYYCGTGTSVPSLCWRSADDPLTETSIWQPASFSYAGPRWSLNTNSVLSDIREDNVLQVVEIDVATGIASTLTSDRDDKKDAFFFEAPEYDGERLMMCLININSLGVFRRQASQWRRINTVAVPSQAPLNHYSAEPFIYRERSFATVATRMVGSEESDIWVVALDPLRPFAQRVNGSTPERRVDPEAFPTDSHALVYYYSYPDTSSEQNEFHVAKMQLPGLGDFNQDGMVDVGDASAMGFCMTSPCRGRVCDPPLYDIDEGFPLGCRAFDVGYDGDVDLPDYAEIQNVVSRP